MLIFFAVSGLWQTFGLEWPKDGKGSSVLTYLTTIHTSFSLKAQPGGIRTLSSPYMKLLVVAMAISLITTIIFGVVMAIKFGHKRTAIYFLLGGIVTPAILVLLALHQ